MRHRHLATLLVAALLFFGIAPLHAQPNPLDGRFVTTGDGALYVVLGTSRHRLQPVLVTAGDLAGLSDGAPVTTHDDMHRLLDAGAPAGPANPAAPAAVPAASPAATLNGTTVRFCGNDSIWELSVQNADWLKQLPDPAGGTATGMWVFVQGQVKNAGDRNTWPDDGQLKIRDERGRTWDIVLPGHYSPLANQYGARPIGSAWLAPGLTDRVIFAFDVAADTQRFELYPADPRCLR